MLLFMAALIKLNYEKIYFNIFAVGFKYNRC